MEIGSKRYRHCIQMNVAGGPADLQCFAPSLNLALQEALKLPTV